MHTKSLVSFPSAYKGSDKCNDNANEKKNLSKRWLILKPKDKRREIEREVESKHTLDKNYIEPGTRE